MFALWTLTTVAGPKHTGSLGPQLTWHLRSCPGIRTAHFKSNVTKTIKSFEYVLAKLKCEALYNILVETTEEAKDKGKDACWQLQRRPRTWPTRLTQSSSLNSNNTLCSPPASAAPLPLPSPHYTLLLRVHARLLLLAGWWVGWSRSPSRQL